MILTDKFLNDLAQSYNGNVDIIQYVAYSNQNTTESATQSSLSNEIGERTNTSVSTTNNTIRVSSIRPTSLVLDTTNGDTIESIGHHIVETGGDLRSVSNVSSINHTNDFDLEIELTINVTRA